MRRLPPNEFIGIASITEAIERLWNLQVIWTDSMMDLTTGDTHFYRVDRFVATHSRMQRKLIVSEELVINERVSSPSGTKVLPVTR